MFSVCVLCVLCVLHVHVFCVSWSIQGEYPRGNLSELSMFVIRLIEATANHHEVLGNHRDSTVTVGQCN